MMNNLMNLDGVNNSSSPKMSSREIAEITGKQHKNVLVDCDKLNENYRVMGLAEISADCYLDPRNREQREYKLTKIQTLDLMTGYNIELRIRVNRRWEELENKQVQKALPQTFAEALRAYADEVEKNGKLLEVIEEKDGKLTEYEPKVEYYNDVLMSHDTLTVTQIAKEYGMSAVSFNKLLHELGIQYKMNKQWVLYQKYADAGYVESKTVTFDYNDGTKGTSLNTQWTQKGKTFLYNLLKENNILPIR